MVTVALHIHGKCGRRGRQNSYRSDAWQIFAKILGVLGILFMLAAPLPALAAESETDDSQLLLPYEKPTPLAGNKHALHDTTPAQLRPYEALGKKDQKALLAQFAVGAIGTAFYTPLARALHAVQEPIHSDDDRFVCRTKLSFSTAYMRCGLKF